MTTSLTHRVDAIRRAAQRIVRLHAWGWTIATVLLAAIAVALVDYLLRPLDMVVRSLLTLAVIGAAIWAVRRWILPAWHYQPTLLEAAQRIELRWPQFAGRLSSSMEFLSQTDDEAATGSAPLRRRVIAEAEAAAADFDFQSVLNRQPQHYGLAALSAVVFAILVFTLLSWQTVALATGRLALPWSSLAWPRWNHLQFVEMPERLARGQNLELTLTDENQRLPESVTVQVQFDDGESVRQEMKFLAGHMVHRIENVSRGFRYRAFGGDDDTMPWQRLDVVEPLTVSQLKVIVHPPAYAGSPWESTGAVFTALEGSKLAVSGAADQLLSAALIKQEAGKNEVTADAVVLTISADGLAFFLAANAPSAWQPKKSAGYVLQLTSAEGVVTEQAFHWDVRLVADAPPTITVHSPADGSYATPQALLPVAGNAKDDIALAKVELRFIRPGLTQEQAESIVLWKASANPLAATAAPGGARKHVGGGQSQAFAADWDLQTVFGVQPGDVLSWFVEAADFRPQTSQTTTARLSIISAEEMQQRLVQRQASALSQLAEALNLQRETRSQIGALQLQWTEVGRWRPRDRDLLHSTELHQRQVQSLVGRTATGATTILSDIISDLNANRLDLPEMADRCKEIIVLLDRLEAERFPVVATKLADLLREARQESNGNDAKNNLATLGSQQDAIAETLEAVLGKLTQWDTFQRIRRDLAQIRDDQRSLIGASQKLQADVVADDSTPSEIAQQHADGRQLGRQENELIRRFEKLQQRLGEFASRSDGDPAAAKKAAMIAETAGKLAIINKMREAASAAENFKLGQSVQSQQEVDRALGELLDALAGRMDDDTEKSLQQLRDLAASLETLEREQDKLAQSLESQPAAPKEKELARLEEQQRKLEQKAKELAEKLDKNQAAEASQAAQKAAGSMNKATTAAQAKKTPEAAQAAREAQKQLAQAKRNVKEQIAQRQADLLREQMARLEQHITGLVVRQEAIKHETERLQGLKLTQQGQLTDAQTASIGDLAIEQETLAAEARSQGQGPQMPAAFSLQLDWTAGDMSAAAAALRDLKLGEAPLASQRSALDRLGLILEALKTASAAADKPNDSPTGDQQPPKEDEPPPDDSPPPDIHDLAEIKLLRGMQAEVNRRTAEVESQRQPDGTLSARATEQLAALAEEQGRVAELALKLVQSLGKPKLPVDGNSEQTPPSVSDEDLLKKLDEALLPQ